jgi:hypothetical protein
MKSVIKLFVGIVAIALIYKNLPWLKEQFGKRSSSSSSSSSSSVEDSCVSGAESASEVWGSGIGKFANPPYDMAAWDDFRSNVESKARRAEEKCLCSSQSCTTAKSALSDLRSLVNEMDQSLRSGSPPPSDLVQRQEAIDNAINSARDLAKQGK